MLISCPSCGKRISDRAPACPFCKAAPDAALPSEGPPPPAPAAAPAASDPAPAPALVPGDTPVSTPLEVSSPQAASAPEVPELPIDDPTATLRPSALPPGFLAARARALPPAAPVPTQARAPEEPPAAPRIDVDRAAIEAIEHLNAGRFADALATADGLLGIKPRNVSGLSTRAQALFRLGRKADAARAIVKAIETSPDSLPLWLSKALMEQEEGRGKRSCRSAMDLVEIALHSEMESALVEQARQMIATFEAKGGFPEVREHLGWLGLGCVSMKAGRAEAALDFFDRAINSSSSAEAFRWKGQALLQLGQADEALALFEAALDIAPNDPEIHHDRGVAFAMLGDSARAVEAFDKALAIDPHHAGSLEEKRKHAG
ncbi:MAG: tetratricopeptide repeat protein [Vicinamibacteria bacterium]|nr:tetratricopeptide repeat protein [Vicinamibacteria bacterium]